jgi:GAF domain-containing protein
VRESIGDVIEEFKSALTGGGVHGALRFLNGRTTYRFTGAYRFDPPLLRNVVLFDRENPDLQVSGDAPLRETYCSIVGETRAVFFTADAGRDEGLLGHPARESVLSYCGVLLQSSSVPSFGTLCHFDLTPRPVLQDEVQVLEAVAPLLAERLVRERLILRAPQ